MFKKNFCKFSQLNRKQINNPRVISFFAHVQEKKPEIAINIKGHKYPFRKEKTTVRLIRQKNTRRFCDEVDGVTN